MDYFALVCFPPIDRAIRYRWRFQQLDEWRTRENSFVRSTLFNVGDKTWQKQRERQRSRWRKRERKKKKKKKRVVQSSWKKHDRLRWRREMHPAALFSAERKFRQVAHQKVWWYLPPGKSCTAHLPSQRFRTHISISKCFNDPGLDLLT